MNFVALEIFTQINDRILWLRDFLQLTERFLYSINRYLVSSVSNIEDFYNAS